MSIANMASLKVPERYRLGLLALKKLDHEQAEALFESLAEVPPRLNTDRLAQTIRTAAPEIGSDATKILDAVLSLVALLPEDDSGREQLAKDVSESPDLELDDETRVRLADRLGRLLGVKAIRLSARALELVTEHDKVFHDARILTDMRPVFSGSVEDGPEAAVVVSTLKVEYHREDRSIDACYFALDRADLIALRDAVNRAIAKTQSLVEMASTAGIPYWEFVEVDDAPSD